MFTDDQIKLFAKEFAYQLIWHASEKLDKWISLNNQERQYMMPLDYIIKTAAKYAVDSVNNTRQKSKGGD